MSDHYHDENDLKLMREMRKLAPDDFNAWIGLNNIVGRDNGGAATHGAMALKFFDKQAEQKKD